ncbi:MAG TPA: stage II sporulation protein P [Clostridia bacterium]|nr:stage II sporulation protein P [Clostridia bacterium]
MKKGPYRRKKRESNLTKRGVFFVLTAIAAFTAGAFLLNGVIFGGTPTASPPVEIESESDTTPAPDVSNIAVELTDFDEGVGDQIRLELLNVSTQQNVDLSGTKPRVLIYHTHTTEAYTPTKKYAYTACGEWRTRQNDRNVVALGEKLAELLNEKYGISVIHDTTNHEPPTLNTAYERSLDTMLDYKEKNPSITLFIDLHRDAGSGGTVTIDGKEVSRMMFVVGTGKGATGTGYGEMPDFTSNYALAKKLTERLRQIDPNLMRDIRVKSGRYNQHVSNQCLLVEVGTNINTFEQSLNAIDYLAQAIADVAGVSYEKDDAVQTIYQFTP